MVTLKELEKKMKQSDEVVQALVTHVFGPEEEPAEAAEDELDGRPPCARCGHSWTDHTPLIEKSCFSPGCKCSGYTDKKRKRLRIRFRRPEK